MNRIRVGVVGTGKRACDASIPALCHLPHLFDIAAFCDPCEESLAAACKLMHEAPPIVRDYDDLLRDTGIDAVILITPNYLHAPMAEAALQAGKALYLEKPMGITVEDCKRILKGSASYDTPMMVGMQLRYSPMIVEMKRQVDGGAIGKLVAMNYTQIRSPLRPGWENWRFQKEKSGGSILEISVHHLDLFHWFSQGGDARIIAMGGNQRDSSDRMMDNLMVMMEYENGVRACIEAALIARGAQPPRNGLHLTGSEGFLFADGNNLHIRRYDETEDRVVETPGHAGMEEAVLEAFYRLAAKGEPAITTSMDGARACASGLAAERSLVEGKPVWLRSVMAEAQ